MAYTYINFRYRARELWSEINTLVVRVQRVASLFQYKCISGSRRGFLEIRRAARLEATSFISRNNGQIVSGCGK